MDSGWGVETLLGLAGRWETAAAVFFGVSTLCQFRRTRRYAAGWALPSFLLLFHNLALTIPVPGALSTRYRTFFWSGAALLFFALLLLVGVAVMVMVMFHPKLDLSDPDLGGCLWFLFLGFWLALPPTLLPIDGWDHVVMFPLCQMVLLKILLIHPATPFLLGICFATQLILMLYRSGPSKAVNNLLIVCLLALGLVQFARQPFHLSETRSLLVGSSPAQAEVKDKPDFLETWRALYPSIQKCRASLVEDLPAVSYDNCGIQIAAESLSQSWEADPEENRVAAVAACLFILVLLGAGTAAGSTRQSLPVGAFRGVCNQVVSGYLENVAPPQSNLFVWVQRVAPPLGAALLILLATLPLGGMSGIPVVFLWILFWGWSALHWGGIQPSRARLKALVARDCKGLRTRLRVVDDLEDPLATRILAPLPDRWLLADLASRLLSGHDTARLSSVLPRLGDPPVSNPACTTLTLVEFACCENLSYRRAALERLPADLWPGAIDRLFASEFSEVRGRAVALAGSRRKLVRSCRKDPEPAIRAAAADRLGELSGREASKLARSVFSDVRSRAVVSGRLSARTLRRLFLFDRDVGVRRAVLEGWPELITAGMAGWLARSKRVDVRRLALESAKLPARRLQRLSDQDPDRRLRETAWRLLRGRLSREAADYQLRFGLRHRRVAAVQAPLARDRLIDLCAHDWQRTVRDTAWRALGSLTDSEVSILSRSVHGDARRRAVESGRHSREELLGLVARDPCRDVRRAALSILARETTPQEAVQLSASSDPEARLVAVRSGVLDVARLSMLSWDETEGVRAAAQEALDPP